MYFYPRPPRGGRHENEGVYENETEFLSTPSARRATCRPACISLFCSYFYPRPPRGGRRAIQQETAQKTNFYPRPPRGGRLQCSQSSLFGTKFLSTPSARRATQHTSGRPETHQFLSTPSARRATDYRLVRLAKFDISIHALREEGDIWASTKPRQRQIFLSTPSARRATAHIPMGAQRKRHFYPRPPRGGRRI